MAKKMKKLLAMALAMMMIVSVLPVQAFAARGDDDNNWWDWPGGGGSWGGGGSGFDGDFTKDLRVSVYITDEYQGDVPVNFPGEPMAQTSFQGNYVTYNNNFTSYRISTGNWYTGNSAFDPKEVVDEDIVNDWEDGSSASGIYGADSVENYLLSGVLKDINTPAYRKEKILIIESIFGNENIDHVYDQEIAELCRKYEAALADENSAEYANAAAFVDAYIVEWYVVKEQSEAWYIDGIVRKGDTYRVAYYAPGADSGSVPPSIIYSGTATIEGGDGLSKDGYDFAGWEDPETGKIYQAGDKVANKNLDLYAVWETETYTVTYKVDGVEVYSDSYDYNELVTIRAPYEKTGYTVSDWSITENFNMPANDVEITATSSINSYRVTYMVDDVQSGDVETYYYGQEVIVRDIPAQEGYTFDGWNGVEAFDEGNTMPAEDVVLTGSFSINRHNVIYKVDGVEVYSDPYDYGTAVTIRDKYVKTGYTVTDWSITEGFNMPDHDVVIVATSSINSYTVTYKVDGNRVGEVETYKYGAPVTVREAPDAREGYTFSGWSIAKDFNMPAEDIVIEGSFGINSYTVTYKVDGEQVGEVETYNYNAPVTIRAPYEKIGYTVSPWDRTENFNMPDHDVIIAATSSINSYTVTYKVDDEPFGEVETYKYGAPVTVREAPDAREGYTFSGWSIAKDFNMPAEDIVIEGSFGINSYTVTYKVDGEQVGEVETYNYNAPVTIRDKYVKTGYTVTDWSITEGFEMPANDVVITAISSVNSYTVTYKVDGETVGEVETYEYGADVTVRAVPPAREGYTFSGWDEEAVAKLSSGKMPAENIVIEGTFDINQHTVIYKVDGETVGEVETYNYNAPVTIRAPYEKIGYTVSPWDRTEGFNMPDQDVIIDATSSINSYTVTYEVDGVQVGEVEEYEYNELVRIRENYVKTGYTVSDWSVTEDFQMPANDVEITAITSVNSYDVIYKVDGNVVYIDAYEYDTAVTIRDKYVKTGYDVTDWSITEGFNMPDQDVIINATSSINSYTVTYKVGGNRVGEVETYEYDAPVTIREIPAQEGYTFSGWSIAEDFNMPAEDIVIEGSFGINSYTVTYKVDGEQVGEVETYNYNAPVTIRDKYEKTGYDVTDWSIIEGFNMPAYNVEITATSRINSYTVTYKVDGNRDGDVETYEYGAPVTVREAPDAREGYTFSGWDEEAEKLSSGNMPAEDIVIEGSFGINSYTVTYKVDGEQVGEVETYNYNAPVTIRDKYVKTGYDVTDWSITEGFEMPANDVVITATSTSNTHTVTWVDEDGNMVKTETVEYGKDATAPAVPEKEGYTGDWDQDGKDVTTDLVIKPVYTIKKYTVVFEDGQGTVLKVETVEHGQGATAPAEPRRSGYRFRGWDVDFDYITANTLVTAQWRERYYDDDEEESQRDRRDSDDLTNIEEEQIPLAQSPLLNYDLFAYIRGYEDITVRPENNITRAEFMTIIFRLLDDDVRLSAWGTPSRFIDVKAATEITAEDWFYNEITVLDGLGLLSHYEGEYFLPNQSITRAEVTDIIAQFVGDVYEGEEVLFEDTVKEDGSKHWAFDAINDCATVLGFDGESHIINGYPDGTFKPDNNITRGEVSKMINILLGRDEDVLEGDLKKWIDNTAWSYDHVRMASNSFDGETYQAIPDVKDWTALEQLWKSLYEASLLPADATPVENVGGLDGTTGSSESLTPAE